MLIQTNTQRSYLAPEIQVNEIEVEQGFAGSSGQLPEYEEDDDEITLG
ncbi:MAG: hypothetical protein J6R87_01225 [Rikenellaceae bacterium]|jgi:hypothetical protein|nr:hypothetical protein [Rikenellaceae bacterium]